MTDTDPLNGAGEALQPHARPNPLAWGPEETGPSGAFLDDDDGLQLIGTPGSSHVETRPRLPADFAPTDALIGLFDTVLDALAGAAECQRPTRIDLCDLSEADRAAARQILLEGEVSIVIAGDVTWQVQEAAVAGVWMVRAEATDGTIAVDRLEVCDIPDIVREQARKMGGPMKGLPSPMPAGVMNAPSILAEIAAQSNDWKPGAPNHVVSFTLLPITDQDRELIQAMLGQVPVTIMSGGFGTCRILATAVRHVWAVQFLSAMGHIILDTVEVGDVPDAAKAAPEDFVDSARRLREIVEAYLS